jgi:hypothetical protein
LYWRDGREKCHFANSVNMLFIRINLLVGTLGADCTKLNIFHK